MKKRTPVKRVEPLPIKPSDEVTIKVRGWKKIRATVGKVVKPKGRKAK